MSKTEPLLLDTAAGQTMLNMTRAFAIGGQIHAVINSAPASGGDGSWYLYRRHSATYWQIIGPIHSAGEAVEAIGQDAITAAHPDVAKWAETQSSRLLAPARTTWPDRDLTPDQSAHDPARNTETREQP
jgi:hypothetical protein